MLKERGTVVAVERGSLLVETIQQSACTSCAAKSGCGQRLLADTVGKNMSRIKAYLPSDDASLWHEGDDVDIGISEDMLVSATLVVYMLPLVVMVFFAYLGSLLGDADAYSMLGALIGLVLGGVYSRWHSFKNKSNCRYHAVVLGPSSNAEPVKWQR